MNPLDRLFLYAVYLDDGGVERRVARRDEVPQVGDRLWAHGSEWIVQRRQHSADPLCDFELDAVPRPSRAA